MKQDDYAILEHHIRENQNRFYRLAFSYLHNEADAKDAIQNAIIKAFKAFSSLKDRSLVSTWFYRILVNECNDMLRSRKRHFHEDIDVSDVASDENTVENVLHREQVLSLLDQLEPIYKEVMILHYFEELTLVEVAEVMQIPLSTVKSRLYRGLELLRFEMQKEEYQ